MSQKELTGYPSIDKPHRRFYREKPIRDIKIQQTIYGLVFNANKENMQATALEYMGLCWTFEKLKKEVDRTADAFYKSKIQKGDVVLVGVSNCLEVVVILLALNKIGATSKWFDIRAGEKDIEKYANDNNCKCIIIFDMLIPKIANIINGTMIEKVLVIYPVDLLSCFHKFVYRFKMNRLPSDSRFMKFQEFIKSGDINSSMQCVEFDKLRPSIMIQSSGTTGKPKIIVHSDYSATVCTKQLAYADIPIGQGKVLLNALPPWIAYALGQAIIYPLSLGTKVKLCPSFEPEMVFQNIGTFTISFAAPFHYRYIRDNYNKLSKEQKSDLNMIECMVSGGDKITSEENQQIEELLNVVLVNGYGNNEGWGALTVNPVKNNKYGTVGIPKYNETIIAYDNNVKEELPYGEIGEICVLAETLFLYYEGNSEETKAVKKQHADGKVWLHTGDLGFIDEDGYVNLCGRARRVIVRRGFKISAYTIEDKICEHPDVKECVVVEVKDNEDEHVPMAYIVLRERIENSESVKLSIQEKCMTELKTHEVPKYYNFVLTLPYTQNGKYDINVQIDTIVNKIFSNMT